MRLPTYYWPSYGLYCICVIFLECYESRWQAAAS
jgi:hypothetical protein